MAEKAEEEVEAEAPVAEKPIEQPETPARRQRRKFAVIQALDKTTAETMKFEVEVGGRPVAFKRELIFTVRACEVSAEEERDQEAAGYLEISLQPRGVITGAEPRQLFRGWMFANAPGVNMLEHPVYDIRLIECRAR